MLYDGRAAVCRRDAHRVHQSLTPLADGKTGLDQDLRYQNIIPVLAR